MRYPGPPPNDRPTIPADLVGDLSSRDWLDAYQTEPTATNPCGPRVIRAAVAMMKS